MLRTSRATMSTIYLAQWDDLMVVQKLQRDLNRRGVTEVDVLQHFESLNPLDR
jgi:uridine kinase